MVSHSLRLCRLAAHPWHASRITRLPRHPASMPGAPVRPASRLAGASGNFRSMADTNTEHRTEEEFLCLS